MKTATCWASLRRKATGSIVWVQIPVGFQALVDFPELEQQVESRLRANFTGFAVEFYQRHNPFWQQATDHNNL
jgi:hypothetical protein